MMSYYAKVDRLGYDVLDLFEIGLELEPARCGSTSAKT